MSKILYSLLREERWEPKHLKEHFKERKISKSIWRMERNINHHLITSWQTNRQLSRVLCPPPPAIVKEPITMASSNLSRVKPVSGAISPEEINVS